MTDKPLSQLIMRSGVVWATDSGCLLACDPETEETSPHARILAWHQGKISESWVKFNAHAICRVSSPEPAVVLISSEGLCAVYSANVYVGNIFAESTPSASEPRHGSFRSVSAIAGSAYAVGLRGMAYRFDAPTNWTRVDEGLPNDFNIQRIHGFSAGEIYAAGSHGELWCRAEGQWKRLELPTNVNLTSINCAVDGNVYVGGHKGLLIRGRKDTWEVIQFDDFKQDIWDLEWFDGALYVSTLSALYRLKGNSLDPVLFSGDEPASFYHLSSSENVLWSIGEEDVMSYDGNRWSRVI
jgi:hypothetical protein